MSSRKEEVLQLLNEKEEKVSAADVAELLQMDRANASRYLNDLFNREKNRQTSWETGILSSYKNNGKS